MASNKSISAIAVLDLTRELALLGIIEDDVVYHCQPSDMTKALERRLPEAALVDLWRLAAENSDYPEIGILIGRKVNNDAKGVLANWISQCQTLAQAFDVFNDNIVLLNASESWTLEYRGQYIKLTFNFSSQYEYPIAAIERSMVALVMWARDLCAGSITVESARFRHTVPEYSDLYGSIFGSNITFSANENSLLFKASVFAEAITSANPYLQEVIAERAKNVLASISVMNKNELASVRVRALILSNPAYFNSVDAVCQEMHLSRTSLYRKLKVEGTSFRQVLEAVQFEKYQQGLANGLAVDDLCDLLGFSDPSTFYKARKRWAQLGSASPRD